MSAPGRAGRGGIRPARASLAALLLAWFAVPLVPLLLWTLAEEWPAGASLPAAWGVASASASVVDAGPALFRSLVLGTLVALVATPVGSAAARAFAQGRVRRPRAVSVLLFTPVALPPFAMVMGLDVVLLRYRVPGPVGILLVLVVVALPYTTYVMRAAYAGYDFAFEDEARTLGASVRDVSWRVRLPLLAPGLAGATFLAFLVGWSDYLVTLVIGGGQLVTLPILVASAAAGTGNEPAVAALSVAALVPPAAALLVVAMLGRRRRKVGARRRPTPLLEGAA